MTATEFFEAYNKGQREFINLDFEYLEGFANRDFSNIVFKDCFLYLDFRNCNFTNAQFIGCNIKEIDLRSSNLTNALMTKCLVECAMFRNAIVDGFRFIENYYYGLTLNQEDFDQNLINSDAYIYKKELSKIDFLSTLSPKMADVTEKAEPTVDIWPFVKELAYEGIVEQYVYDNNLVEKVYRNQLNWCDQVLLPTRTENSFVIILVDLEQKLIMGYYRLNLNSEYGLYE